MTKVTCILVCTCILSKYIYKNWSLKRNYYDRFIHESQNGGNISPQSS